MKWITKQDNYSICNQIPITVHYYIVVGLGLVQYWQQNINSFSETLTAKKAQFNTKEKKYIGTSHGKTCNQLVSQGFSWRYI